MPRVNPAGFLLCSTGSSGFRTTLSRARIKPTVEKTAWLYPSDLLAALRTANANAHADTSNRGNVSSAESARVPRLEAKPHRRMLRRRFCVVDKWPMVMCLIEVEEIEEIGKTAYADD